MKILAVVLALSFVAIDSQPAAAQRMSHQACEAQAAKSKDMLDNLRELSDKVRDTLREIQASEADSSKTAARSFAIASFEQQTAALGPKTEQLKRAIDAYSAECI